MAISFNNVTSIDINGQTARSVALNGNVLWSGEEWPIIPVEPNQWKTYFLKSRGSLFNYNEVQYIALDRNTYANVNLPISANYVILTPPAANYIIGVEAAKQTYNGQSLNTLIFRFNILNNNGTLMLNSNCAFLVGHPTDRNLNAPNLQHCDFLGASDKAWDKVTNMHNMFGRCDNLLGNVQCGNNVINMSGAQYQCKKISGAASQPQGFVCGPNVTNMAQAQSWCNIIGVPVIGPKVQNASQTQQYTNLSYLNNTIPDNVIDARGLYQSATLRQNKLLPFDDQSPNLQTIYIGTNVQNLGLAFDVNQSQIHTTLQTQNVLFQFNNNSVINNTELPQNLWGGMINDLNWQYNATKYPDENSYKWTIWNIKANSYPQYWFMEQNLIGHANQSGPTHFDSDIIWTNITDNVLVNNQYHFRVEIR